jgi:hypothetical protein
MSDVTNPLKGDFEMIREKLQDFLKNVHKSKSSKSSCQHCKHFNINKKLCDFYNVQLTVKPTIIVCNNFDPNQL